MRRRHELSDAAWARLAPLLPPQQPKTGSRGGRPNKDHRLVVEGMLWILRTGAPWRDLPKDLRDIMARARASGLLDGRPAELADQFGSLLLGDLMTSLLLGVAKRPSSRDVAKRARAAAAAFLQLHAPQI